MWGRQILDRGIGMAYWNWSTSGSITGCTDGANHFYPYIKLPQAAHLVTISQLIHPDSHGWNQVLIHVVFSLIDVLRILSTLIHLSPTLVIN